MGKFCSNCGNQLIENSNFCSECGNKISEININQKVENENLEITSALKELIKNDRKVKTIMKPKILLEKTTTAINNYTDETGSVDINLSELFSEIPKKHTKEEAENIFIVGTHTTTPAINDVSEIMGKPWLFSRVFLYMLLSFVALWFAVTMLDAPNALPGFIMVGAFMVPLSSVIFFYELNAYKNISIVQTVEMFFVGGAVSIAATLLLFEFFPLSNESQFFGMLTTTDAITIGVVEEIGKLLLVIYYIRKLRIKYILNGLLIGCAIGSGFAAFETAGYILGSIVSGENPIELILLRGGLAIGGHIIWTAIAGGALVMVKKSNLLEISHFFNTNFLFFFISVITFHSVWDMEFSILGNIFLKYILLIIFVWVEAFVLINAGFKEISKYKKVN